MATNRISVRIGPELERSLRDRAVRAGKDESAIVREALERYFSAAPAGASAYDAAVQQGLIGCGGALAPDLSTNKKHFRGFGKAR